MKRITLGGTLLLLSASIMVMKPVSAQQKAQTTPLMPMHFITTSPEEQARTEEYYAEYKAGVEALRGKNYPVAEDYFQSVIDGKPDGSAYFGLAETLVAEGHIPEAMQNYRMIFHPVPYVSWGGTYMTKAHLEYALLLNESGQWAEAVAHYNAALSSIPSGEGMPKLNVQLDLNTPLHSVLAAAAHIGIGLYENAFEPENSVQAFQEYTASMQLAPDWDAANYYYGYGWGRLDPKDRAKVGSFQQAKAALQKAVKFGKGDVKVAAQKALLVAVNTK